MPKKNYVGKALQSKLLDAVKTIFYTVKVAVSENYSAAFYFYTVGLFH